MRHQAHGYTWPEIVPQAVRYAHAEGIGALMVDTFAAWSGLRKDEENSAGSVTEVLRPLTDYAAASGLAVLLSSHQRKSGGEHGEAVRGSNALTGAVDIVVELERATLNLEQGKTTRVLRSDSRYGTTEPELVLTLGPDGYEAHGDTEHVRENEEKARILETLAVRNGATPEEIAGEADVKASTVYRRLGALQDCGDVRREGRGVKGDPYRWFLSSTPNLLREETNSEGLFE